MSGKKPAKAPAKTAPKAPAKPAAKAPAKAAAKPAAKPPAAPARKPDIKASGKPAAKPGPLSSMGKAPKAEPAEPAAAPKMEKLADGVLCQIEVLKDGHFFIARTQTDSGQAKEYKNTVFEDLLTEMLITLQEQLAD